MPARGGNFQRALDILLSHHVAEVRLRVGIRRGLPRLGGRERCFAAQMLHKLPHGVYAVDCHAVGKRRLGGVFRRDVERLNAELPCGQRHRQHARHRAEIALQTQLAQKRARFVGLLDELRSAENAE